MKPLNQLIDSACDVEEAAEKHAVESCAYATYEGPLSSRERAFGSFKAGADHVAAKLGPALMEAIRQRDAYAYEYRTHEELSLSAENQKIRALLESRGE